MIGDMIDPRKLFGEVVTGLAEEDDRIVVMSADSGKSSGFTDFAKKHPDRYFECGIMEQGVTGISSGLATMGKIPVFCAIAPFVTSRNFEMYRNDLGYMRQNVKVVGRNGGITYSDLGATHHSLEDYAIMRMIPGNVVLAPADPTEIKNASIAMIKHDGPVYMRIGNPKIPILFEDAPFEIGKGRMIQDGKDITVITTGYTTASVIEAVKHVEDQGYSVLLIGMPTVWPLDEDMVIEAAEKTGKVITIEEHYLDGGLGTIVAECLADKASTRVRRLGLPLNYIQSGPYEELLAHYGLDPKSISEQIIKMIKEC